MAPVVVPPPVPVKGIEPEKTSQQKNEEHKANLKLLVTLLKKDKAKDADKKNDMASIVTATVQAKKESGDIAAFVALANADVKKTGTTKRLVEPEIAIENFAKPSPKTRELVREKSITSSKDDYIQHAQTMDANDFKPIAIKNKS